MFSYQTLSTLSKYNELVHLLFWLQLNRSVVVKEFMSESVKFQIEMECKMSRIQYKKLFWYWHVLKEFHRSDMFMTILHKEVILLKLRNGVYVILVILVVVILSFVCFDFDGQCLIWWFYTCVCFIWFVYYQQ